MSKNRALHTMQTEKDGIVTVRPTVATERFPVFVEIEIVNTGHAYGWTGPRKHVDTIMQPLGDVGKDSTVTYQGADKIVFQRCR